MSRGTHKHRTRAFGCQPTLAQTPRWMRPKLAPRQRRDLSIAHHTNLDAIANGEATPQILWDWVGGCLTWSRVAQMLKRGEDHMQQQLLLADRVIGQFEQHGIIQFATQADYQLAVDGVIAMDLLAEATDAYSAGLAADWSEAEINSRALAMAETEAD